MGAGLNKVRGRVGYVTQKAYKEFIKKYPNSTITWPQFETTILASNTKIRWHIFYNPLGFKLPLSLGYIAIIKFKQKAKYKVTDWANTVKNNKVIPLLNFHSFGYMFKIKLFRNSSQKPVKFYDFKPHRTLNRELAQIIKGGKQDYLNLDNSYFTKNFRIEKLLNKTN